MERKNFMRRYDLQPTSENLYSTYKDDAIGRNIDIYRFLNLLNSIDYGCSIALEGNWGSGKTFFVRQTKMLLDACNSNIKVDEMENRTGLSNSLPKNQEFDFSGLKKFVSVYYDAWMNDNDDDPILSLVYSILLSVKSEYLSLKPSLYERTVALIELFYDKDWKKIIENFKGTTVFDDLAESKDFEKRVSDFLNELLEEKGDRLVIFVDELDRCNPRYAVRFLERVKHYFDNDKITFVFSVNLCELKHTICKFYGQNFDGARYLDRFFDLRVLLPEPNLDKYYNRIGFYNSKYHYDSVINAVIKHYHFELREISRYVQMCKIAAYEPTHGNTYSFPFGEGRAEQFILLFIVPILIGLKIYDIGLFNEFIDGKSYEPLLEIFRNLHYPSMSDMLNSNETFQQGDSNKTYVSKDDKLVDVYNAIFNEKYDNGHYQKDIGELRFDSNSKKQLMKVVGLLSKYTSVNEE